MLRDIPIVAFEHRMRPDALLVCALLQVVRVRNLLASQLPDGEGLGVSFTSLFDQARVSDPSKLGEELSDNAGAIRRLLKRRLLGKERPLRRIDVDCRLERLAGNTRVGAGVSNFWRAILCASEG
jgi:hypothetical protein